MKLLKVDSFEEWRELSRRLIGEGVKPSEVTWTGSQEPTLFEASEVTASQQSAEGARFRGAAAGGGQVLQGTAMGAGAARSRKKACRVTRQAHRFSLLLRFRLRRTGPHS